MKFVTKADFDKAIATVELALKNGQVKFGHYADSPDLMTQLLFSDGNIDNGVITSEKALFISPEVALKESLVNIRLNIARRKGSVETESNILEKLEKKEKELVAALAALKE